LARLRREVEEVRGEIKAREQEPGSGVEKGVIQGGVSEGEDDEDILDMVEFKSSIDELSNVLEGLQTVSGEERGAQTKLAKKLAAAMSATTPNTQEQSGEQAAVDVSVIIFIYSILRTR